MPRIEFERQVPEIEIVVICKFNDFGTNGKHITQLIISDQ